MQHFNQAHWLFAESRLTWLEGGANAPALHEAGKASPQEKPTEEPKPEITKPPTDDADKVLDEKLHETAKRTWEGKNVESPQVFEQELQKLMQDFKSESEGKETSRGIMSDLNTLFVYCPENQREAVIQRILSMNADWRHQGLELKFNGQLFNFDEILKQAGATDDDNSGEQKPTEVKKFGLSENDRNNKEVSKKNISISLENLDFVKEAKEELQSRLQSWVESSVSTYVDVVNDELSTTQSRIQKDMERQVRLVQRLTYSINDLDERIVEYLDEKSQLDPSDERHKQLTRLSNETIREANIGMKMKNSETDDLLHSFDETDMSLDEKQGKFTDTYKDKKFSADDSAILDQYEQGFHSTNVAKDLIEALSSKKPLIGLLGSRKTVNLEMAQKNAQDIYKKMSPEQRKVFEQWLQKKVADAGRSEKVLFDRSGQIYIES